MSHSGAGLGVALLVAFLVFHYLGIFTTIRAVLAIIGLCLLGAAGFGLNLLVVVTTWLQGLVGDITHWIFGVRFPAALFIILVLILIYDLHPKNKAGKRTAWVGVFVVLLMLGGVAGFPAVHNIPNDIRRGVENAQTAVQSGGR